MATTKKKKSRPARRKSIFLRNFTGRVSQEKDKRIFIQGVNNAPASMRRKPAKKKAAKKSRAKGRRK